MDPASAIGIASSVLAFIDFSWKLIHGTFEIYRSPDGTSDENARLEDVMDDLKSLAESLQAGASVRTKAERNIKRLAQDCQEDAEELLGLLSEMKVSGRRRTVWRSLGAKWTSILKKDEVTDLKSRLRDSRAEITLNLTLLLREDQTALNHQITQLQADCADLKISLSGQVTGVKDELLESIHDHGSSTDSSLSGIIQQLRDFQALIKTIPIQHRILRQLLSDGMDSRRDQILEADADTCRWLLDGHLGGSEDWATGSESDSEHWQRYPWGAREPCCRQETREKFVTWLRTGRDVLHISGNAGSGKSTLMKFIGSHERTRRELETWAGTKTLVFGQFYFWNPGSPAQRTLPGLYRSLLFQAVAQCPDLIEDIFPSQANRMASSAYQDDPAVERFQAFGDEHVRQAFDRLLQKTQSSSHRFCFLIDGLDEFEGKRLEHEDLAAKLKGWAAGEDVKLLVSSRPWQEFSDIFTANPTIHLHELNGFDIKTYCLTELQEDRAVRQQDLEQTGSLIREVVGKITELAQGIFLWAHLVLDAVRQGVRQGDSLETLMLKLEEYPSDLDGLYTKLREPIERSAIDRERANQMLLLALKAPDRFRLYAIAFSWLDKDGLLDPEFPVADACQPYTEVEIAERLECARRRVNGLTRGLLEIFTEWQGYTDRAMIPSFTSPKVRFCHKTARDYLIQRYAELQASWPNFDQVDVYGRLHLADCIYGLDLNTDEEQMEWKLFPSFCESFDVNTIRKFEAPLGSLLRPSICFEEPPAASRDKQDQSNRVSFVQYAGYCGTVRQYVLSVLDTDPAMNIHSPGSNILLGILESRWTVPTDGDYYKKVCSALVEKGVADLGRMVDTRSNLNGQVLALPTWVIAMYKILNRTQFMIRHKYWACELVELARTLHEYGIHVGQSLSMTVEIIIGRGEQEKTLTFHVSTGEVVCLIEHLAAEKSGKSEPMSASIQALLDLKDVSRDEKLSISAFALDWQSQHIDMHMSKSGTSGFNYRGWRVF